jgi:hypothetical protein
MEYILTQDEIDEVVSLINHALKYNLVTREDFIKQYDLDCSTFPDMFTGDERKTCWFTLEDDDDFTFEIELYSNKDKGVTVYHIGKGIVAIFIEYYERGEKQIDISHISDDAADIINAKRAQDVAGDVRGILDL